MLGNNVGRWRAQTLDPEFGGYLELSIHGEQRCELRLGAGQRLRQRGFTRQRGRGVGLDLEESGTLNACELELMPAIRGVLRAEISGRLSGRPFKAALRLIKVSSAP